MKRWNVNYGKTLKQWRNEAFNTGKEIEAKKRLAFHRITSSLLLPSFAYFPSSPFILLIYQASTNKIYLRFFFNLHITAAFIKEFTSTFSIYVTICCNNLKTNFLFSKQQTFLLQHFLHFLLDLFRIIDIPLVRSSHPWAAPGESLCQPQPRRLQSGRPSYPSGRSP